MATRARLSLFPLAAAFVAVVVAFVASTLYSQYTASAIHDEAMVIALDDAPSIEHLALARASILRLPRLVADHIAAVQSGQAPPRTPIALEWDTVNRELELFLALPTYPEESAGARDIRRTLAIVDGAIPRALGAADAGDWLTAEKILDEEIEPFADRSTATIQSVILVDAGHVERTAAHVEKLRRRAKQVAYTLDAISVLLSIGVAVGALRFVRQYSSIVEERKTWLERRSEELEQFAGRVAHDVRAPLAPIALALGFAARDVNCSERTKTAIDRGLASLGRLRVLIEDLLTFARAGAAPEPGARASVSEVVADVIAENEQEAAQSGVELAVVPFAPCSVPCTRGVFSSILSNLVGNAIKYIGEG
ncbi:MAG: histidine kinase dimerization/phospho-acceptor domain-containing protein, partial [Polyangiales bacterium]